MVGRSSSWRFLIRAPVMVMAGLSVLSTVATFIPSLLQFKWLLPWLVCLLLIAGVILAARAEIESLEDKVRKLTAFDDEQLATAKRLLERTSPLQKELLRKLLQFGPTDRSRSSEAKLESFVENMRALRNLGLVTEEHLGPGSGSLSPRWYVNPKFEAALKFLMFPEQTVTKRNAT